MQMVTHEDTSPLLEGKYITLVQSIVGALLYYARAIKNTLLTALNNISTMQAHPTEKTKRKCNSILDYVATSPNVKLCFHASDMQLHVDSDAAYLVASKAISRVVRYYSFPNINYTSTILQDINHPILVECRTLQHVVASPAEEGTSGLFHNVQTLIPLKRILTAF